MDNHEVFAYTGGFAPAWLDRNAWFIPVQVSPEHAEKMPKIGLKKIELKVRMCCTKCAEIVVEEIKEVGGVFDVKVDQIGSKVTVIGRPYPADVLKRAKRVDKKAQILPDPPPPPPPAPPAEPEKPKEEEKAKEEEKPKEEPAKADAAAADKPAEEKPKEEEPKPAETAEAPKPEEAPKPAEDPKPAEAPKPEEPAPAEAEKKVEDPPKPVATASAVKYQPYEHATYQYPAYEYQYRPSQSYNPLHAGYNNGYYVPYSQVFYDYPYFKTANEKHIYGSTVQPPRPASYSNGQEREDWWGIFPT